MGDDLFLEEIVEIKKCLSKQKMIMFGKSTNCLYFKLKRTRTMNERGGVLS